MSKLRFLRWRYVPNAGAKDSRRRDEHRGAIIRGVVHFGRKAVVQFRRKSAVHFQP
jgi:hypothetical protein